MDETYLRVRSAGSQGSFLTRQYLEEVLPQSSFFRRFPVPDLEISSPEESRGEGRARAVLRALGCEPVPLSRQGGEEGLFAVIPGKDAAPGMILCVSEDRREYAGLCRAVDAAAIPSWPSGERPGWAAWTNGDVWVLTSGLPGEGTGFCGDKDVSFELKSILHCPDAALRERLLKCFALCFGREGMTGFLSRMHKESLALEEKVEAVLTDQAQTALRLVARALWRAAGMDGKNRVERREKLKEIHREAMVFVLRLTGALFAAARGVSGLASLRKSMETGTFPPRSGALVLRICDRLAHDCSGSLFVRRAHPLLELIASDDGLARDCLSLLTRVSAGKRTLSVDWAGILPQFPGVLYEAFLKTRLVPDGDGGVDLFEGRGRRRAACAFYTRDTLIRHLVRRTIGEKLKTSDGKNGFALPSVRVLDPAMGCGRMLLASLYCLLSFTHRRYEETDSACEREPWNLNLETRFGRLLAENCLFGVDLDPLACDIARMTLWIRLSGPIPGSFPTPPFLEGNLVCGSSIVGPYEELSEGKASSRPVSPSMKLMAEPSRSIARLREKFAGSVIPERRRGQAEDDLALCRSLASGFFGKAETGRRRGEERLSGKDAPLRGSSGGPEDDERAAMDVLRMRGEFLPVHWRTDFPEAAAHGGFDVIIANPPWDVILPYRAEFFRDYIPDYGRLDTREAMKAEKTLLARDPAVRGIWQAYRKRVTTLNAYFLKTYASLQPRRGDGTFLRGHNNIYKVFLEKIYLLLAKDGLCGIIVPDNLNIDSACTGLRRLLLQKTTIRELVTFVNRRKLFDIHGQYKFDVLTFMKRRPSPDAAFDAGFSWYDPVWLDGRPSAAHMAEHPLNAGRYHRRFRYPVAAIFRNDPDTFTIWEFGSAGGMNVLGKLKSFPGIGDPEEELHILTSTEFNMTTDSDLFRRGGNGWPLFQGRTIHHYNASFGPVERRVDPVEGEKRLARRRRSSPDELPDRNYRLAWRVIAQATDSRSLIGTVIPPRVFCGNALNAAEIIYKGKMVSDPELLSGLNVILSSLCADFYVRLRSAKNVSAFIVRSVPVPRDIPAIRKLGRLALPLYLGAAFAAFRGSVPEMPDPEERIRRIALLDAMTARLYGLGSEEYGLVLDSFPLLDEVVKRLYIGAFLMVRGNVDPFLE